MSNYHLEVSIVSRKEGRSIAKLASYISGERLYDAYKDQTYHHNRQDVLYWKIFQPGNAPPEFYDLQSLCDAIEGAETRYDARLAREFIGSLPNELSTQELIQIVNEFIIIKRFRQISIIPNNRNLTIISKLKISFVK